MLSVLMRSGSPVLSLRPLGATVVALALMGCLEPPRLPTAGSDGGGGLLGHEVEEDVADEYAL